MLQSCEDENDDNTEDGDDNDDKDAIIDRLKHQLYDKEKQLEEAKVNIKILNEELFREKVINNKLLGISTPAVASPKGNFQSNTSPHPARVTQSWDQDDYSTQSQELAESQLLTPAQRTRNSTSNLANSHAENSPVSQMLAQRSPVMDSQHFSPSYLANSVPDSQKVEDNIEFHSENANNSVDDNLDKHMTAEIRRMKRAKGMLFGLKRIPASVNTIFILDSNGRDIVSDQIDGDTGMCSVRAVGGLCMPALCDALDSLVDVNISFKKVKTLVIGLGANDILHNATHPQDKSIHIVALNNALKNVFPNAVVHYIPPFAAIKAVGQDGVDSLLGSVKSSGVGWKIHQPPSMKGKLAEPELLHIRKKHRSFFTDWLRTRFGPKTPTNAFTTRTNSPAPSRTRNQDMKNPQAPLHREFQNVDRQRCDTESGAQYFHQSSPSQYQLAPSHGGIGQNFPFPYPPAPYFRPQFPPIPPFHGQMVRNISEAVAAALLTGRQNGANHYQ